RKDQADDRGRERGMLGSAAGHRIDLAAEKFVLDVARCLEREVLAVSVVDLVRRRRHEVIIARGQRTLSRYGSKTTPSPRSRRASGGRHGARAFARGD